MSTPWPCLLHLGALGSSCGICPVHQIWALSHAALCCCPHATHTRLTAGMFNCLTTQSLVFAERVVFYRERVGSAGTAVAQCGRGGAGRAGWGCGCGLNIWANLGAWGCTGGVQVLRSASVWALPWAATAILVSSAEEPLLTKCGVVLEPTSALQQVHSTHHIPTPNQPPA